MSVFFRFSLYSVGVMPQTFLKVFEKYCPSAGYPMSSVSMAILISGLYSSSRFAISIRLCSRYAENFRCIFLINTLPKWIIKCSQFPSCVDFTGFNCIQNCVYCYYLSFFSKIALKHRPHYFHI